MAMTPKVPTKSAFLQNLFRQNPKVTPQGAEEAWNAAGYDGGISHNTFYNYKSEFNKTFTGKDAPDEATAVKSRHQSSSKRLKTRKTPPRVSSSASSFNDHKAASEPEVQGIPAQAGHQDRDFDEIEDGIDDLIYRLKHIGGKPEVLQALRRARRLLYAR